MKLLMLELSMIPKYYLQSIFIIKCSLNNWKNNRVKEKLQLYKLLKIQVIKVIINDNIYYFIKKINLLFIFYKNINDVTQESPNNNNYFLFFIK